MLKRAVAVLLWAGVAGCTHEASDSVASSGESPTPPLAPQPGSKSPVSDARQWRGADGKAYVPSNWIPSAPARRWNWIVIHHSATDNGSATSFDRSHRARGWDGMGYDFVIDNGRGAQDGL